MRNSFRRDSGSTGRWYSQSLGLATPILLLALLLAMPGCSGCTSDKGLDREAAAKARAKAEEERKLREKEPFVVGDMRVQPYNVGRTDDAIDRSIKPGHWTSGSLVITANREDFSGLLGTEPVNLPDVPFRLSTTRPLALSKGQPKTVDTLFFVPVGYSQRQLATRLLTRRGAEILTTGDPLVVIPAHQFFFVVLAREPDRYAYLRKLDIAGAPTGHFGGQPTDAHYRVVLPRVRARTPLPTNPLAWTNIAYLLWDDQDPDTLTLPQQGALVDWLHFGGQLIVSGPDSLSTLKGSFLESLLPATTEGKLDLSAEMLAPLVKEGPDEGSPLVVKTPWAGETLQPKPAAEVVLKGAGEVPLVVEGRVGNGRVVVTAFRIGQRQLVAWDGNDSFLNRFLLRRPGRLFTAFEGEVAVRWLGNEDEFDSRLTSRLRFFSRDAELSGVGVDPEPEPSDPSEARIFKSGRWQPLDLRQYQTFDPANVPRSVAAWNDHSDVATMAQKAVRDATRIEIPNARFVVRMMALYLLVLVPVNWLVFRAIGRVEWAWIAAPLIALLGAVVVVRAAQLDIGFARAKNELATLELFADHPRAHLTRYTTLYTSLSTNYDLHYSDATAIAQPFPLGVEMLYGQGKTDLELHRGEEVVLRGVPVSSNSVGIVHSEQMFELGGTITIAPEADRPSIWRITNGSKLSLKGAGVLQPDGAAWIGDLKPGESATLEFTLAIGGPEWENRRMEAPETAASPTAGVTHLGPLVNFAETQRPPGEWRLVAWTEQELPGVKIEPRSPQSRQATVVVAHLRPGKIPLGERDRMSRAEVEASLKTLRVFRDQEPVVEPPSEGADPAPDGADPPSGRDKVSESF